MKNLILSILIISCFSLFGQDKVEWRVIPSFTDWIDEINNWPDSIYEVQYVRIKIDSLKDSLLIGTGWDLVGDQANIQTTINKPITINHLEFLNGFGYPGFLTINNIRFKGAVRLFDYHGYGFVFHNMIFEDRFSITEGNRFSYYHLINCEFKTMVGLFDVNVSSYFNFVGAQISAYLQITRCLGKLVINIENSNIERVSMGQEQISEVNIRNSRIGHLGLGDSQIEGKAHFIDNEFGMINLAGAQLPNKNTYFSFEQVSGKLFSQTFGSFGERQIHEYSVSDTMDFSLKEEYDLLLASYQSLLEGYQSRGDQDSYNACYVEMKNIETRRLAYLYNISPNFRSYFTWKINQFLKVFSAYGTEPARAVIYSLYVILAFSLIYLFFPNSWDKHGKKRIMDRFRFFTKYLNKDAGIHEVYLEEKNEDLLEFEDFKTYMETNGKTIPKFFTVTALPLYKWAISGTKISSIFLKRIDIIKGTWRELPEQRRWWKGVLLIGAFCIAIIYDIFIKMLNALMLSINTFTTLGFGEIPIRGLPRYLAIIQGFIGWFMLTIFSVSLISQLLN